MINALHAARFLCEKSESTIGSLDLNRMLYLMQLVHLGKTGCPLIDGYFISTALGTLHSTVYKKTQVLFVNITAVSKYCFPALPRDMDDADFNTLLDYHKELQVTDSVTLVRMTQPKYGAWNKRFVDIPNCPCDTGQKITHPDMVDEYMYYHQTSNNNTNDE